MSYRDYLLNVAKMHPDAVQLAAYGAGAWVPTR